MFADNGYYLFPDTTPLDAEGKLEDQSEFAIFYNVAVAMPSLWIWWSVILISCSVMPYINTRWHCDHNSSIITGKRCWLSV